MIYQAKTEDINAVYKVFEDIIDYEEKNTKYSVFTRNVYPTEETFKTAIESGDIFVLKNENNEICACVKCNYNEPKEYKGLPWTEGKALVVHLLGVSPLYYGKGYGTAIIRYIFEKAKAEDCVSVKLDTGGQNKPAQALYENKLGFKLVANTSMDVGGLISQKEHLFYEHLL